MTYKKLKSLLKTSIAINGVAFIFIVGLLFVLAQGCTPKPQAPPPPSASNVADIVKIVGEHKACLSYSWKDRCSPGKGCAPRAYMNGMAVVFARSVCRQTSSDVLTVSVPVTSNVERDALAHYKSEFARLGMKNDGGLETLRHVYTLLIGLGMRESSGRHCCGRDTSSQTASVASKAQTVEAGVMQTSYDSKASSSELPKIFAKYEGKGKYDPECLYSLFSDGVTCNATNWKYLGVGADGLEFQRQQKECPASSVEYAAVMMRKNGGTKGHYGPLRTKKAEVVPACDEMLKAVQSAVESNLTICGGL